MSDFDTYDCEECGEQFAAHPSSSAADNGYCSPACESDGRGLA
jgi:hypothetical protein